MPRIPKQPGERIAECETHLYFLWDARRLYPQQRERYKQIATELRVLVCETNTNRPLLLDLMDQHGFTHEVQPRGSDRSGSPLKLSPLDMVGSRDDPHQKEISDRLAKAFESGNEEEKAEIARRLAELAQPVPFREWVNKGLALEIAPYEYSHRDFVLAIAQQVGSSHEDESVEEPIVRLRQIKLAGVSSEVAVLISFADYVISVGTDFVAHLVKNHGFQPKHFEMRRS